MPYRWLRAFVLTIVLELPVYLAVARFRNEPMRSTPNWRLALGAVMGSAVTHPILWFIWPQFFRHYVTFAATGELFAFVLETFIFFAVARPITLQRATVASLLANGFSFGCGLLLYALKVLK
jgi:hypothetical protein